MRVLVTGAGGLLGGRLASLLAGRFEVVAGRHRAAPPAGIQLVDLDLLSPTSLERALAASRADAVVHAAALADADRCEAEPERAARTNVEAAERLARLCHGHGLHLVSVSTDLVLGGTRPLAREDEPVSPLLVYGRSKLLGEEAVLGDATGAAVVRVALVLGRGYGPRATASEAVAWALRAGRTLRLFTDQYRTPVDAESVADALTRILATAAAGRFHLGGPERLSRHELGLRVAAVLGLPPGHIEPATQASGGLVAARPADASLDSTRARRELGWVPRPLDLAIREGRAAPG